MFPMLSFFLLSGRESIGDGKIVDSGWKNVQRSMFKKQLIANKSWIPEEGKYEICLVKEAVCGIDL